jgi:hypothetical protein
MKLKTTLAALVLAALPATGFAAGCSWGMDPSSAATTCDDGKTYDPASGTCVTQATS